MQDFRQSESVQNDAAAPYGHTPMTDPYAVACPVCGARAHNQCRDVPKGSVHAERSEAADAVTTPERAGGRRGMLAVGLVLGVILVMGAFYANAVGRADGDDPSVWLYVVGGFGLLLVLAVFLDAVDGR